uniref:Helicase ATP-binding domain-containing protein n=1 Tax=viral metagenome TaxID=1070528 RepID=A0A6C0D0E2_9ZZZZ
MKLNKDGYIIKKKELTEDDIKKIKTDLTVSPFTLNDFGTNIEKKFTVYLESPKRLYLPRFYGIQKFGKEEYIGDMGEEISCDFNGELREIQKPIYDKSIKEIKNNGGGIISLKCGGGKTILALYILSKLKLKTIIVVHKDFLMSQWIERIEQFIPTAKIGRIQKSIIDIEDKDIVLAMAQSLSIKEYSKDIFKSFGFAIFDECHHFGAEIFHKCMLKVSSRYMLGLSATPNRKDGLKKVFEWFIGPLVYVSKDINKDYVEVDVLKYECDDEKYCKISTNIRGNPCNPIMINNICDYEPRTKIIIDKIIELYNMGRDILFLSDRRNHLVYIYNYLILNNYDCGYYIGGMKQNELKISQEKKIILGTFSMASEGMDIPKLNSIILGSPKSDIEQSIGRILRQPENLRKFHPYVFDICDNFSNFVNQYNKRLKFYNKNNYDIHIIENGKKTKYVKKSKNKVNVCLID